MKDLFSDQSELYQQARPSYPQSVIDEIFKYVQNYEMAWDCGAGSGQFTRLLAPHFNPVIAMDLSEAQLQQAPAIDNVIYRIENAEHSNFKAQCFDLITVAQAIHWFDFELFFQEVYRTLKPQGVFAVIGYGLIEVENEELQSCIEKLYHQVLKPYWESERHYIDLKYQTIPFPFEEIPTCEQHMHCKWRIDQLIDYLNTWSALKKYLKQNTQANNQATQILNQMSQYALTLNNDTGHKFNIRFPIFLRIGKLINAPVL
ncbi:class I SAM-dependent methyltransferase [Acinetobacter sp. YH16032]|uniref:class I SAM-dependent methyltransferase n=1 Tax=Acinetobacter sp. YH16032 TaxID=2601181 RepID=UPI0015D241DD